MRFESGDYVLDRSVFIKDFVVLLVIGYFLLWMYCLYKFPFIGQFLGYMWSVTLAVFLTLCGVILCSASYGLTVSSELYFRPFIVLQYFCYCCLLLDCLVYFTSHRTTELQLCFLILYLFAISHGLYYCVSFSNTYIAYLRKNLHTGDHSEETPIYVYSTQKSEPVESSRGFIVPDSMIDDIFSDYEDFIKLE